MRITLLALAVAICAIGAQAEERIPPGSGSAGLALFWQDRARGWHFYEDPPPPPPKPRVPEEPAAPPPAPPAGPQRAPELVQFDKFRQQVEEARQIAVMNPTEPHVRRYMEMEAQLVRQASAFSDVAQRVAWTTPSLDMTLEGRPVNARAIDIYDRDTRSQRSTRVAALAPTHALFFFFRSDCPYCHAFAPVLERFARQHGLSVMPVSLDGGGIEPFSTHRVDNGIARTLNVQRVPAVYLAEPAAQRVTPVGFGVLSEEQLLERISTLSDPTALEALPPLSKSPIANLTQEVPQ
jgi:conjugal transfer pilus assembly protein TraF